MEENNANYIWVYESQTCIGPRAFSRNLWKSMNSRTKSISICVETACWKNASNWHRRKSLFLPLYLLSMTAFFFKTKVDYSAQSGSEVHKMKIFLFLRQFFFATNSFQFDNRVGPEWWTICRVHTSPCIHETIHDTIDDIESWGTIDLLELSAGIEFCCRRKTRCKTLCLRFTLDFEGNLLKFVKNKTLKLFIWMAYKLKFFEYIL